LTLKPGSSDSFKDGIATVTPVGELPVTAPVHIPVIDTLDANSLFYHQNEATGFLAFQDGEVINEQNATGEATIDSANVASARDVDPSTGQILYIDNRAAVTRSDDATEDIKIIIQL